MTSHFPASAAHTLKTLRSPKMSKAFTASLLLYNIVLVWFAFFYHFSLVVVIKQKRWKCQIFHKISFLFSCFSILLLESQAYWLLFVKPFDTEFLLKPIENKRRNIKSNSNICQVQFVETFLATLITGIFIQLFSIKRVLRVLWAMS